MTDNISHQELGRRARKVLNPSQIAVSLAWYDRTYRNYHVYGFFPLAQSDVDGHPWPVKKCTSAMGTGSTPEDAIEALESKFYGGL